MRWAKVIISLAVMVYFGFIACAGNVKVEAYVSDKSPCVGANLDFTVSISGDFSRYSPVDMPAINGFQIYGRGTSQSMNFINGRMSNTVEMNYMLIPLKEGDFTIPSLTVIVDGKGYQTDSISISVKKCVSSPMRGQPSYSGGPGRRPVQYNSGNSNLPLSSQGETFATVNFSKKRVCEGEPIIVTYTIYTRKHVTFKGFNRQPDFSGFVKKDIASDRPLQTKHVYVGSKEYVAAQVYKFLLLPIKAGEFKIDPGSLLVGVEKRGKEMFGDFFDVFNFDDFFPTEVPYELPLPKYDIEVAALPKSPDNFSGAVGEFSISASLDKDKVKAGEAATLKVQITGKGNLSAVDSLNMPEIKDSRVYQSSLKDAQSIEGDKVISSKQFEFIIIPNKQGRLEIPSIDFVYFSPEERQYKKVSTKPLFIDVSGNSLPAGPSDSRLSGNMPFSVLPVREERNFKQDIAYIKDNASVDAFSFNFVLKVIIVNLVFLAALLLYLYFEKIAFLHRTDSMFRRKSHAMQSFMRTFEKAKGLVEKDAQSALDLASNALLTFIADKAHLPRGKVSAESLPRVLSEKYKLNDNEIERITNLLSVLSSIRFAGQKTSQEQANQLLKEIAEITKLLSRRAGK